MKMKKTIPSLPVYSVKEAVTFYEDRLGFEGGYRDEGFAILTRDEVEIHLWAACDNHWKFRSLFLFVRPVWSGAESFLAGTASCRIKVENIDELFTEYKEREVIYSPDTVVEETEWGTLEFPVLDLHRNLLTLYERLQPT